MARHMFSLPDELLLHITGELSNDINSLRSWYQTSNTCTRIAKGEISKWQIFRSHEQFVEALSDNVKAFQEEQKLGDTLKPPSNSITKLSFEYDLLDFEDYQEYTLYHHLFNLMKEGKDATDDGYIPGFPEVTLISFNGPCKSRLQTFESRCCSAAAEPQRTAISALRPLASLIVGLQDDTMHPYKRPLRPRDTDPPLNIGGRYCLPWSVTIEARSKERSNSADQSTEQQASQNSFAMHKNGTDVTTRSIYSLNLLELPMCSGYSLLEHSPTGRRSKTNLEELGQWLRQSVKSSWSIHVIDNATEDDWKAIQRGYLSECEGKPVHVDRWDQKLELRRGTTRIAVGEEDYGRGLNEA